MIIAETDRLIIREFKEDDAAFVVELLNTPGWLKYIGDRGVRNIADAEKYIEEKFTSSYTNHGFGIYLVLLKEENIPIGMCGFVKREGLEHVDLGFAFLPDYERKGYAYESATSLLEYATRSLQLSPIIAIVTPGNKNSIALLQKLNFEFETLIKFNGEELMLYKNETGSLNGKKVIAD